MAEPTGKPSRRSLRIGKYEVVGHIATGGMGAVYRALDTELNRPVALKVLSPELAARPTMVERFRREARSARALRHENIVTLYEFGEANGTHYLALEFVDGTDLHNYITRRGRLKADEARALIIQAARALDHAYNEGIVHRDVKPSNFLITTKDGRPLVKLTDMGLAKQIREDEYRVTKVGTTVGTVDYMAPEQARNSAAADIRSDIYSLGCTLYHMLAGCAPFPEGSMAERILKHVEAEPPDVRNLNPDVPPDLVAVLQKMLQKHPDDRYQTPSELLKDLENPESVTAQQNRGDGLSRLADLAREEATRPAEPPVRDTPVDNVVDDPLKANEPEEEVILPAGRRTKRLRDEGPVPTAPIAKAPSDGAVWWPLAVLGSLLLIIGGVIIWALVRDPGTPERKSEPIAANDAKPPPPRPEDQDKEKDKEPKKEKEEDPKPKIDGKKPPEPPPKTGEGPVDVALGPPPPQYPPLFTPLVPPSRANLRHEFMAPFEQFPEPPADAKIVRVGRALVGGRGDFATLADAVAAMPMEQPTIIELHDNGPLFTPALAELSKRRLWIRPGPGYRPLLAWEHPAQPSPPPKDGKEAGLCLLPLSRSVLVLEDLDIVSKWPEIAPSGPASFFTLRNGELQARRCTLALAGKPPDGVAIVQIAPGLDSASQAKVRLSHCYVRGAAASVVRVAGCGADVLLDDCLCVGGPHPLFAVRTGENAGVTVRALRSTLVATKTMLDAHPLGFTGSVSFLCCDTLLARSDPRDEGHMIRLAPDVNVERFTWRGVNCVFAGWQSLFTSSTRKIPAHRLPDWMAQWSRQEGIQVYAEAWPRTASQEPELMPPAVYSTTDGPLCYAAVSATGRLGAELGAIPAGPDEWLRRTFERYLASAPALAENVVPAIPPSDDGLYHGERVDLSQADLGEVLHTRLQSMRPAPRVVLHLAGQGERPIGPVTTRGIKHLVLYVERPEKGPALTLVPDARAAADREALFEIEGGIVEMIGARVLFRNDKFASLPRYMFAIRQGELRLAGCELLGPLTRGPDYFQGLFACAGGAGSDEPSTLTIHESILQGAPSAMHVRGGAARLRIKQSVIVAPRDVLRLDLGTRPAERLPFYALLENNTFALRRTFLHIKDAAPDDAPGAAVLVQAQANVFLDPFADEPGQSCLLRCDPHTLARGDLLWQGIGNGFDVQRLGAFVRIGDDDPGAGGMARWRTLWGNSGERKPLLLDLPATDKTTFKADLPRLERLALPSQLRPAAGETLPGANLLRLGIHKKTK